MNDVTSAPADIQTAMLDAVCDTISSALLVYDRNDRIVFASRKIQTYFSLNEAQYAIGTRLRDFLGALYDYRNSPNTGAPQRGGDREDWVAEHLALHWKERVEHVALWPGERWLRSIKRRLPSGMGICVVSDVSEQKKREDQWRTDIERVQVTEEILDHLPLSIFVKDHNTTYVAANKAGCALLEMSEDVILGRTVFDIHSDPLASRIDAMDRHVLATGIPSILPERVTRLTGEEALVITRKQRVGKPGRYFLVTTMDDVTAFATTSEDGKSVIRGLEHMSFTPSSYREDEQHQAAQLLKGRSILLVTPNADLGEIAQQTLQSVGVDFAVVASHTEEKAFLEFAASANVRIDLVIVDVQLDMACLDMPEAYGVKVITADDYQLESSLLGLVTGHFRLNQSCRLDNEEALAISTGSPQVKQVALDVLVVEDNNINQIVFAQILESLGLSYKIAASAREAFQLFDQDRPSLVLMDTTLPDVDGFEAARRLRKMTTSQQGHVPVIGIVSLAFEGDRQACIDAGMDDMLLKPISPDMIEILIRRFMPQCADRLNG